MIPFSVLDLSSIVEGGSAAQALRDTRDLARHVERLGYHRFWLAEHHNMAGVASAATAVVIGHVGAATSTIRIGSGGIMLPNHAPLVIAEQFGTLEALFPGRVDLGLGRAPGTDQRTARALRRDHLDTSDTFPQDVRELQGYFREATPGQAVRAVPGAGLAVPIWLLGSSLFSAQLAARYGLPFAFAAHFAPDLLEQALELYRREFRASEQLERPYTMAAIGVFAAETEVAARRMFTSWQQVFVNLRRGRPTPLPPPVDDIGEVASPLELALVAGASSEAVVGSPETVRAGLEAFIGRTGVDELMVTTAAFDQGARLRSYELVAEARSALASRSEISPGVSAGPAMTMASTEVPTRSAGGWGRG